VPAPGFGCGEWETHRSSLDILDSSRRVSGVMNVARPFKAGIAASEWFLVALATNESGA